MESTRVAIIVDGTPHASRWLAGVDDGFLKLAQDYKRLQPASVVEIVTSTGTRHPITLTTE